MNERNLFLDLQNQSPLQQIYLKFYHLLLGRLVFKLVFWSGRFGPCDGQVRWSWCGLCWPLVVMFPFTLNL